MSPSPGVRSKQRLQELGGVPPVRLPESVDEPHVREPVRAAVQLPRAAAAARRPVQGAPLQAHPGVEAGLPGVPGSDAVVLCYRKFLTQNLFSLFVLLSHAGEKSLNWRHCYRNRLLSLRWEKNR